MVFGGVRGEGRFSQGTRTCRKPWSCSAACPTRSCSTGSCRSLLTSPTLCSTSYLFIESIDVDVSEDNEGERVIIGRREGELIARGTVEKHTFNIIPIRVSHNHWRATHRKSKAELFRVEEAEELHNPDLHDPVVPEIAEVFVCEEQVAAHDEELFDSRTG